MEVKCFEARKEALKNREDVEWLGCVIGRVEVELGWELEMQSGDEERNREG